MTKVLIYDLETTELQADRGHLLTACAKWLEEDHHYTWRIDSKKSYGKSAKSFMDDKFIVAELIEMMNEADMLVGHYIDRFDTPFINTRALFWGMSPPAQVKSVDTWKVAKQGLLMRSNRLATLCELLNSGENQKGGLSLDVWKLAGHGDKKTISSILEYNIQDVYATEELYLNLRPVMKSHPYIAAPDGGNRTLQCHVCGSHKTKSQGSYYTKLYAVRRRRCNVCDSSFEEGRSRIK